MKKAIAFAPATVANVAVGFDILGFALQGLGETAIVHRVELKKKGGRSVVIEKIPGFLKSPVCCFMFGNISRIFLLRRSQSIPPAIYFYLTFSYPGKSGINFRLQVVNRQNF